jgi:hypothetical protein
MLIRIDNRTEFISNFLSPVVKMSDSARLAIGPDTVSALVASADNSLILYAKTPQVNDVGSGVVNLNVPNVTRLINLLSCLTDVSVDIEFDDNRIMCRSGDLKFKYHLLDDDIISTPGINIEKIKKLDFNTSFFMTKDTMMQVIKASSFTTDTDKLYISTDEAKVVGELTDKQQANVDSFSRPLSMSFNGDSITEPVAINFELLRMIGSLRISRECNIIIRINRDNGVIVFDIVCDENKLKYVTSAYAE